jgi:SAM-dependent methyltransferase
MPAVQDPISWYDANASERADHYESVRGEEIHAWMTDLLPVAPAVVVDVGAGNGRNAAWLASLGHDVVAVEPSSAMRSEGVRLHPDARIRWLDDRLPSLFSTTRLGLAADAILLSAVWMHIFPADRPRAFRKLASLLRSGGLMVLSLRHGPADPVSGMHPVSIEEVERLARDHRMVVVRVQRADDRLDRAEVSWSCVALRLPDDGSGALSLLRHHQTLRCTPAMAAGVTTKLWELADMVKVLEDWEMRQVRPAA